MKNFTLYFFLIVIMPYGYSQIDWHKRDRELYDKYKGSRIPELEIYEYAGGVESYNTYLLKIEPIQRKNSSKLRFYFVKNDTMKIGGWNCTALYLENNTSKSIFLNNDYIYKETNETIYNEIRDIKEYIGFDNKWYELNRVIGDCGSGIFKGRYLNSGEQAKIYVSMNSLNLGNKKALFKVSIKIDDKWIDSDIMEIKLFENQIKRLISRK